MYGGVLCGGRDNCTQLCTDQLEMEDSSSFALTLLCLATRLRLAWDTRRRGRGRGRKTGTAWLFPSSCATHTRQHGRIRCYQSITLRLCLIPFFLSSQHCRYTTINDPDSDPFRRRLAFHSLPHLTPRLGLRTKKRWTAKCNVQPPYRHGYPGPFHGAAPLVHPIHAPYARASGNPSQVIS